LSLRRNPDCTFNREIELASGDDWRPFWQLSDSVQLYIAFKEGLNFHLLYLRGGAREIGRRQCRRLSGQIVNSPFLQPPAAIFRFFPSMYPGTVRQSGFHSYVQQ
jgi:hypothetical protein